MNGRQRILNAMTLAETDRVPLWFMRQAGRYLPEYRAMKAIHGFRAMVGTPDLAAEVTLQPIRRFPEIDAAILFSDILVVPEALGMPYRFREAGGIGMEWRLENESDLNRLSCEGLLEKLAYVFEAATEVKRRLGGERALLGFGGSPWTLATYMIEGGSSVDFSRVKELAMSAPALLDRLLALLTEATQIYFEHLITSGVDAIQIFDSWGSLCPGLAYESWSLRWIREIINAIGGRVPVILFSKGMAHHREGWRKTGAQVFSLDSSVDLGAWASEPGRQFALQGNLDPVVLAMDPSVASRATADMIRSVGSHRGYIFNLGHGITPDARVESVEAMIEAVEATRYPAKDCTGDQ